MAQRTVRITPLPKNATTDDLQAVLKNYNIVKTHIMNQEGYVEFGDVSDIEALEFQFGQMSISTLGNASIQKVQEDFKWESIINPVIKSENSEPEESSDNAHQSPVHLTKPDSKNLVIIKKCNGEFLRKRKSDEIKKEIFGEFHSINRILKHKDSIVIEFEDLSDIDKLAKNFQSKAAPKLGQNAQFSLEVVDFPNFAEDWIKQENIHEQLGSSSKESKEQKQEVKKEQIQIQQEKTLHDEALPKLDKVTSFEANFHSEVKCTAKQEKKKESRTEEIHVNPCFIIDQKQQEEKEKIVEMKSQEKNAELNKNKQEEQLIKQLQKKQQKKEEQEIRRQKIEEEDIKVQKLKIQKLEEQQEKQYLKEKQLEKQKKVKNTQEQEQQGILGALFSKKLLWLFIVIVWGVVICFMD